MCESNRAQTMRTAAIILLSLVLIYVGTGSLYKEFKKRQYEERIVQVGSEGSEVFDGNALIAICDSDSEIDAGICLGYVFGAVSVGDLLSKYCAQPDSKLDDIGKQVVGHIRRNRGLWNQRAESLVLYSLTELYPCLPELGDDELSA